MDVGMVVLVGPCRSGMVGTGGRFPRRSMRRSAGRTSDCHPSRVSTAPLTRVYNGINNHVTNGQTDRSPGG